MTKPGQSNILILLQIDQKLVNKFINESFKLGDKDHSYRTIVNRHIIYKLFDQNFCILIDK